MESRGGGAGLVLVLLVCLHGYCVSTYTVQISPTHIRISEEPNVVTVSCTAGVSLDGCQFKWWDFYQGEGPTLELGRGAESTPDPAHTSALLANYTYSGRGLEAGDCGVTLHVEGWKSWMVACRVRTEHGAWSYKWTDLYAQGWGALKSFAAPREAVVMPGGLAKFLVLTREPLSSCHFFLPDVGQLVFDEGSRSPNSTGNHTYYGLGLERGECGLALRGVSEQQNGIVRVWVATGSDVASDNILMALVVARGPSGSAKLSKRVVDNATEYTCVVDGRPLPSTVTWTLSGEVIRRDGVNDLPEADDEPWHWPWSDRRMEQRVTVQHRPEHRGKTVECSFASHALRWPVGRTEVHDNSAAMSTSTMTTSLSQASVVLSRQPTVPARTSVPTTQAGSTVASQTTTTPSLSDNTVSSTF